MMPRRSALRDEGAEPPPGAGPPHHDRRKAASASRSSSLAESIIGLFNTEVIRKNGPWRSLDDVEMATLTWVHWFNQTRLLEAIGDPPPAEFQHADYAAPAEPQQGAGTQPLTSSEIPARFTPHRTCVVCAALP